MHIIFLSDLPSRLKVLATPTNELGACSPLSQHFFAVGKIFTAVNTFKLFKKRFLSSGGHNCNFSGERDV